MWQPGAYTHLQLPKVAARGTIFLGHCLCPLQTGSPKRTMVRAVCRLAKVANLAACLSQGIQSLSSTFALFVEKLRSSGREGRCSGCPMSAGKCAGSCLCRAFPYSATNGDTLPPMQPVAQGDLPWDIVKNMNDA